MHLRDKPQRTDLGLLTRGRLAERELALVVDEVLGAVVVDVEQAHGVGEVGVPVDGEMHAAGECLVAFSVEVAVEGRDGPVELSGEPWAVENQRAAA